MCETAWITMLRSGRTSTMRAARCSPTQTSQLVRETRSLDFCVLSRNAKSRTSQTLRV
jgi:hypothetical protein